MNHSIVKTLIVAIFFAARPPSLYADDAEDYIFAGDSTSLLQIAVMQKLVTIETIELRKRIVAHEMDALIVPGRQAQGHEIVRYSERGYPSLRELKATPGDVANLRRFAAADFLRLVSDARRNAAPNTLNKLAHTLKTQDELRKGATERFVGAALADVPSLSPDLSRIVTSYRDTVENQAADVLSAKSSDALKENIPYTFPNSDVPLTDLRHLKANDVGQFQINGREYHKAWLGSNLIIVRPGQQAVSGASKEIPESLKLMEVSPNTAGKVMGLNPTNRATMETLR